MQEVISKIFVALDSTVLKQYPQLAGGALTFTIRYARIGAIRLFIPRIVEQEYLSWGEELLQEVITATNRSVSNLERLISRKEAFRLQIVEWSATETAKDLLAEFHARWKTFVDETSASIVPILEQDAQRAFESYFHGKPPFKRAKNRDDIPDAFIFEAVNRIAQKVGHLFFVTQDDYLRNSFKKRQVSPIKDLQSFVSLDSVREALLIDRSETRPEDFALIVRFFGSEFIERAAKTIARDAPIDGFLDNVFETWQYMEGPDLYDVTIPTNSLTLDLVNITVTGNELCFIPFGSKLRLSMDFKISREEFGRLTEAEVRSLEDFEEDDINFYRAKKTVAADARGTIGLHVPSHKQPDQIDIESEVAISLEKFELLSST